jgi:type II secretion system protein N
MTSTRVKILFVLGMAVLIVVAVALAVFREFPYGQAAALFKSRVELATSLRLDIGDIRPGWPFTLKVSHLDAGLAVGDHLTWLARAKPVRIRLRPALLLTGRLAGTWQADLWQGHLKGRFEYRFLKDRGLCLSFEEAALPGFLLDTLPDIGTLEGSLKGRMSLCGSGEKFPQDGTFILEIGPGRLAGRLLPGLPKVTTAYDSLKITGTLTRDQLSIEKLDFASPTLQVVAAGRIFRMEPPRIQLTGRLHLGPAGDTGPTQSFTLAGPLDNPRATMSPSGMPPRNPPGTTTATPAGESGSLDNPRMTASPPDIPPRTPPKTMTTSPDKRPSTSGQPADEE